MDIERHKGFERHCKKIAEFMGFKYYSVKEFNENYEELQFSVSGFSHIVGLHYLSLDNLIPVWEKLAAHKRHGDIIGDMFLKNWEGKLISFWCIKEGKQRGGTTVREAALIATSDAVEKTKSSECTEREK